jgi:hypothetical protein
VDPALITVSRWFLLPLILQATQTRLRIADRLKVDRQRNQVDAGPREVTAVPYRDSDRKAERAASRHWVDVRPRRFFVFSAAALDEKHEPSSIDSESISASPGVTQHDQQVDG